MPHQNKKNSRLFIKKSGLYQKRQPPYWVTAFISVGVFLFSRAVASQVSSAPLSLTSVFGMGTGGPSASSTPTTYIFITFSRTCKYLIYFFPWFLIYAMKSRKLHPIYFGDSWGNRPAAFGILSARGTAASPLFAKNPPLAAFPYAKTLSGSISR